MSQANIDIILSTVDDGRTKDLRYRQRQFISLQQWITAHVIEIEASVRDEGGMSKAEAQFLTAAILVDLRRFYDGLDLKQELGVEYSVAKRTNNDTRSVPEELTYLVPDKHTLLYSITSALCACIAAGSCCLVQLPSNSDKCAGLCHRMLAEALDTTAFTAVNTRPPTDILQRCLVIDQTQSVPPGVGRKVLRSEPDSWAVAIVDRTANLEVAAQEIMDAKSSFSGNGPYAPTCILINEFVEQEFLRLLHKYSDSTEPSSATNGSAHISKKAFPIPKSQTPNGDTTQEEIAFKSKHFRLVRYSERSHLAKHEKKDFRSVPLLAVSSHDDAIDTLHSLDQQALSALYAFADPPAAKYLTQFISTRVSFVNHIPPIGPAAPIDYAVSSTSRYRRDMIETPSPQFVKAISGEVSLKTITQAGPEFQRKIYNPSLQPLKPTGQPKEGDMNFFAQAMMASYAVYVGPMLLGLAVAAGFGMNRLYRLLK